MENSKSAFLSWAGVAFSGFIVGALVSVVPDRPWSPPVSGRVPAQSPVVVGDWVDLPCATPQEFARYEKELNIRGSFSGELCDDSPRAKLAKAFKLLENLRIRLPKNWKLGAQDLLRAPYAYLQSQTDSLELENSATAATGQNRGGAIWLFPRALQMKPYTFLAFLLHEARHSDQNATDHETCWHGDQAGTLAPACDKNFSVATDAGAYSYEFAFMAALSLHGVGLSPAERKALASEAVLLLSNRFNEVPPELALSFESILASDAEGRWYWFHPLGDGAEALPPSQTGAPVQKIFRSRSHLGPSYRRTDGKSFRLNALTFPGIELKEPWWKNLRDAKTVNLQLGTADMQAYQAYLSSQSDFYTIEWDFSKNELHSTLLTKNREAVSFDKFSNGLSSYLYLLTSEGQLYFMLDGSYYRWNGNNARWKDIESDFLGFRLHLVGEDGKLYFQDGSGASLRPEASAFRSSWPILRYLEGASFRTVLTEGSRLVFQTLRREEKDQKNWTYPNPAPKALRELALLRTVQTVNFYTARPSAVLSKLFVSKCRLQTVITDPWSGRHLGLDAEGRVILEGPTVLDLCRRSRYQVSVAEAKGATFHWRPDTGGSRRFYLTAPQLELRGNGDRVLLSLRPYSD